MLAGYALVFGAMPATTTVIKTTFQGAIGDVHGGYCPSSMFGAVAFGTPYSLVYMVDDAVPGATFTSSATHSGVAGSAVVSAALTMNGITRTIVDTTSGSAAAYDEYSSSPYAPIDKVSSRVLAGTPAVPEPASWTMMLGGFGLIGGQLRRRGVVRLA